MGVCDGVATHPVKQEVLRTPVKRICRQGTTGIESGFEESLNIGIRNVLGLKTKYDEISKELELRHCCVNGNKRKKLQEVNYKVTLYTYGAVLGKTREKTEEFRLQLRANGRKI
jgi:hypothetical protein